MMNKSVQYKWLEALKNTNLDKKRLDRGEEYAYSGNVTDLNINRNEIKAEVEGNYDNYEVEINFKKLSSKQIEILVKIIKSNSEISLELSNGNIPYKLFELLEEENIYLIPNSFDNQDSYCDCLDDIRPCKHIIAVYYALSQEFSEKPLLLFELNGIPLKDLFEKIEIPLSVEYKSEKTLKQKMQERLKTLLDKADKATLKEIIFDLTFRSKENYIKYLDVIEDKIGLEDNETTENSSEKFIFNWDKLKWKLKKIEEYGYDFDYDEAESLEIEDKFNEIINELEKKEASKESRKEFIDEALSYINSDFDYRIMDVIYAACYDKDELYYFAENIRSNSPEMAMKIYKQLSEKEEYLKLRLDNLESSSDYYNLVQFYEENNEPQKAIKTAYEGLQKVQYHKGDLQEYLAEKALNSNNREEYLKLKFDKYTDRLTLQDYKSFENICNKKEWQQYESKIISKVEKLHSSNKLLIYMHRKEFEKAANTLLENNLGYNNFNSGSIIFSVADQLKTKYPEKVLQFYLNSTGDLDSAKDRKVYANQALIVLKIRDIWVNVLKTPEKWLNFARNVKYKNKNRKAFQEEFRKVISEWNDI